MNRPTCSSGFCRISHIFFSQTNSQFGGTLVVESVDLFVCLCYLCIWLLVLIHRDSLSDPDTRVIDRRLQQQVAPQIAALQLFYKDHTKRVKYSLESFTTQNIQMTL